MDVNEVYDGFEGEKLSEIWSSKKLVPGAFRFQDKIRKKSGKAIEITIQDGDNAEFGGVKSNKMTERDELLEQKKLFSNESEGCRYEFSLFVPKNFPIVPTRLVLAQWKQRDEENKAIINNPVLALRYVSGKMYVTLKTSELGIKLFETNEEIRGKWLDFAFETKFTRKNDGFIRGFLNGKKIIDYEGRTAYSEEQGYPPSGRFYFKMGLYRDKMKEPMTAYFDEYRKTKLKD